MGETREAGKSWVSKSPTHIAPSEARIKLTNVFRSMGNVRMVSKRTLYAASIASTVLIWVPATLQWRSSSGYLEIHDTVLCLDERTKEMVLSVAVKHSSEQSSDEIQSVKSLVL